MKISCPNCQRVIQAPDEWAGRKVKCPGCKQVTVLPQLPEDESDAAAKLDFDSLGALEDAGEVIYRQRSRRKMTVAEAQAAAAEASDEPRPPADPKLRVCPNCGEKVKHDDIYVDLMCRHCGGAIPGAEVPGQEKARYTDGMAGRMSTQVSFYTGFTGAFLYPIPALVWILLAMGIALATIAVPLLGVLAFTAGSGLNPIAEKQDFGWVAVFLSVMFGAQALYFGSVGYYAMIDTIRTTGAGSEQPPSLTWNVTNLGSALGGYIALLGLYVAVILGLMFLANGHLPDSWDDLAALARPINLFIIALMTFGVPMNMIGLSSSHALDGLNPVRVFRSIGATLGPYIFLFLIVLLYLGVYIGAMVGAMRWAAPAIMNAAQKGMSVGLLPMLGGPAAWAILIGLGFYFAYSIGRVLGLFTRSFKEGLDFDL